MKLTIVDTNHEWDFEVHQTITCWCDAEFRGNHKLKIRGGELINVLDRPCPACGKDVSVRRVTSDPELMTI